MEDYGEMGKRLTNREIQKYVGAFITGFTQGINALDDDGKELLNRTMARMVEVIENPEQ